MKLYLVRHGEALDKAVDPQRPLSESGRQDIEYVAVNLGQRNVQVDWMWHSGILRASQTAELLAEQVSYGFMLEVEPMLEPEADIRPIAQRLNEIELDGLIVSHMPFIGTLLEYLLKDADTLPIISFSPGTVYCLEKDGKGRWHYCWKLEP